MITSQPLAILTVFIVTVMWGSWFQTVKHTGKYTTVVYISWMYLFSVILVWSVIGLFHKQLIPDGLLNEVKGCPWRAAVVFISGIMYAIGIQLNLTIVKKVGLILSTSITTTCTIFISNILTVLLGGGLPEGVTIPGLIFAGAILILATVTCQVAGVNRDKDRKTNNETSKEGSEKIDMKTVAWLIIIPLCFSSFYYVSSSVGLRTELNPNGFSSLTVMGILSLGAVMGTWMLSLIYMGVRHDLGSIWIGWKSMRKIFGLAAIAAVCHFGGNILHAIAAPSVSVVIATALGNSYNLWSYVWGLLYGEFKGASRKTYLILTCGIALFAVSSVILTVMGT